MKDNEIKYLKVTRFWLLQLSQSSYRVQNIVLKAIERYLLSGVIEVPERAPKKAEMLIISFKYNIDEK